MLKRIISLLLCAAMVFSSMPLQAFANTEPTILPETLVEPVEETTAPAETVTEPTEEATMATEAMTEPAEEATVATEAVTEPAAETTVPVETVTEPTEEATVATEAVTEPTVEATVATEAVTEPAEEATAPREDTAEVPESVIDSETVSDGAANAVATEGTCGENLTWVWDKENMLLTISGTGPMEDFEANGSPWYGISNTYYVTVVIENGVTTVGNKAFYNAGWVDQVTLPETLVSIGDSAFYNCGLDEVTIPASVANIGSYAFADCDWLSTINIPEGITEIKDSTFSNCSHLTNITLPASVTTIGERAFFCCESLNNNIIHEGITSIGASAFANCTHLSVITIPDNITAISENAFMGCTGLKYLHLPEMLTSIGPNAFFGCESLVRISIPETVTEIGSSAFYGCNGLTTLSIPDGITVIEYNTFAFSENLAEIILPSNLQSVEDGAFQSCLSLKEIVLPDTVSTLGEEAFQNCSALEKVVLGPRITVVESFAFENCSSLTSITLSGPITEIKQAAFSGCSSLAQIQLPNTLTSIASYVFRDCIGLITITLPESLEYLMGGVFQGCTRLASLHIPKNVRYFGDANLAGCTNLKSVTVDGENTSISSVDGVIYAEEMTTLVWCHRDKEGKFTIPESVDWIHQDAFAYCTELTEIVIPDTVKVIPRKAFYGCTGLLNVNIPSSVTTICSLAFAYCENLTTMVIPSSVTSILKSAFVYCTSLHTVSISKSVRNVESYIFEYCYELKNIVFDGTEAEWNAVWDSYPYDQSGWINQITLYCIRMGVWANPANLSILTGEEIHLTAAMLMGLERDTDVSGITFQIADTSILELVKTGTNSDGLYVDLTGLKEGSTTVTFNDSNTGCMAVVLITVSDSYYYTYTLSTVPEKTISGGRNNFYAFNGLYIDNFSYSTHTDATVSFDVYNANYTYAIAEIYDENNNLSRVVLIPKKDGNIGSVKEFVVDRTALLISDIASGNLGSYRTEISHSKHTAVSATVPKGGYIRITNDPKFSSVVNVVNLVDVFFGAAELVGKAESYSQNSKNFLNEIANSMITIGLDNFVNLTAEKLVLDKDSIIAYIQEIHTLLNDNEFLDEILRESAIEFGFEFVGTLLSSSPLVLAYEIANFIFDIGDGIDLVYQIKELGDSHGFGKIEIQNVKENNRTNGNVTIQSETAFPDDVVLNVFEVTLDDGILGNLEETLPGVHEAITKGKTYTYNISLLQNKQEVQPDSSVTVYIPIPEDLKVLAGLNLTNVYRVEEDGTLTNMQATIENGCFVFTTEHFSLYVLSGYDPDGTTEDLIASGSYGDNLTWKLDTAGLLTVSGTGEMAAVDYEAVPWHDHRDAILSAVIESGVTTISRNSFEDCQNLVSISIPDTVTTIDSNFSYCTSLESIVIPGSVTKLDQSIFTQCSSLKTLEVADSNSVYASKDNILYNKELTTLLRCPPGFEGECIIPEGVTSITASAFSACGNLTAITLPQGLEIVPFQGFQHCDKLTTVVIPDSVTTIDDRAFYDCDVLTDVVIPDSVTTIHAAAFAACYGLTEIVIPDSVTQIDGGAFSMCDHLKTIRFEGDAPPSDPDEINRAGEVFFAVTATAYYPANNATWTEEVMQTYGGTITWVAAESEEEDLVASGTCGDNLTWKLDTAGLLTISGTGAMTEFAADFSDIPWYAYREQIAKIEIGSGVETISDYAFVGCSNAAEMTLPETLISIGYYSFWDCSSLGEIYIPASVTSINIQAFSGCSTLQGIRVDENNATYTSDEAGVLFNKEITKLLRAPATIQSYSVPDTVSEIGLSAFDGCSSLKSITIPASVSQIDRNAFFDCSSLETVDILDLTAWCNITFVDDNANPAGFAKTLSHNGETITQLEIPSDVTAIRDYAFGGIQSITGITMPDTVTSIGQNAFSRCVNLTSVTMSRNVTQIGTFAFWGCEALTAVEIPDGVENVAYEAFAHCYALETAVIGKVSAFESGVFWACSNLKEITFTSDAPTFGENLFYNVTANARYPSGNVTWTSDVMQNYGGTLTWIPYGAATNRVTLPAADLAGQTSVWIDGAEYALQTEGDNCYVDLPDGNARTLVTHTYNIAGDISDQTHYPVGMKVWLLENENGVYNATRQEIFDDILQYSGMSIRVTGKKGIRMITSMEQDKKNALVSDGLEGLTLKEYGTVVAWASNLTEGNPLVLGQSYALSNYAYKKGVADPVFAYSGSLMQYTNVLVNFTDEQCKNPIALRPYMILEDASGETVTIYGGIVYRSIGYIAYQNRNVFEPQTEEYNYIWTIIRYVYGDVYDDEFVHA